MRFIYFLLLLAFIAVVGVFAFQNSDQMTVHFFHWNATSAFSVFIAGAYLLGMLSGWTVIGFIKRSLQTVTAAPIQRNA
jgi:putative membrane protein